MDPDRRWMVGVIMFAVGMVVGVGLTIAGVLLALELV